MPAPELIVRSRRVVTRSGVRPASLHLHSGKIVGILAHDDVPAGVTLHDAGESVVMPGLVDTHVHINEPGRTDWEGFETATRAAAAGGVTTLIDMPLNSIPATTAVEALEAKRKAAAGKCQVDVGFWGGVVPGNTSDLESLWKAGVFGFKCFMVPSGVPEFEHVTERDLREALPVLSRLGAPLLAHAELPEHITGAARTWFRRQPYAAYLATRPKAAENAAIDLLLALCRDFRTRIHIVHLSSSDALTPLYHARAARLPVTVETCPHYLFFVAEEIPAGATDNKCAPPVRERDNREFLWASLAGGLIDMVVSDHSPSPPALKHRWRGDFMRAWGGIASLQFGLPIVWTEGSARGYRIEQMTDWMRRAPARLAGFTRKGAIDVGYDADLVIWNPDASFRVDESIIEHRHKLTPYLGRELRGIVEETYLRGERVYGRGQAAGPPRGRLLSRGAAAT